MENYPKPPNSEKELDFEPRQPMVDWFSPSVLMSKTIRILLSGVFGSYADKREMQAALAQHVDKNKPYFDYSSSKSEGDFWFDFIADLGDGWNSTYSMAKLLSQEQLSLVGDDGTKYDLPRGKFVVMGGDEVYPVATRDEYKNRTTGPYQSALPYVEKGKEPDLFAIQGNHDWYDGLTSFLRVFCSQKQIGGWQTQQTRSYFALKLPHNWWLWGIDIQFDTDIDKPQWDYFCEASKQIKAGDKVILCVAEPEWVYTGAHNSDNYPILLRFEKMIEDNKGVLPLSLTGDLHHYCRYKAVENGTDQKITAGGGGAFMAGTQALPKKLELESATKNAQEKVTYSRAHVYPDVTKSRFRYLGALLLPFYSWKFAATVGGFYLLYAWLLQSATHSSQIAGQIFEGLTITHTTLMDKLAEKSLAEFGEVFSNIGQILLYSPSSAIFTLVVLVGLMFLANPERKTFGWVDLLFYRTVGLLHGIAHVVLIILLIWFFAYLNLQIWGYETGNWHHIILLAAEMFVVGGFLGAILVGFYLTIGSLLLGLNLNESFSCQHIEGYKNFLRLRIDKAGKLTVYPIGLTDVGTKWEFNPDAKPGESWFEQPATCKPLSPHLIEEPIDIPPKV
jgi:hypothetical protein